MIRKPIVADAFYPSDPSILKGMISQFMKQAEINDAEVINAVSFIAPHAGYLYSGQIAAYTYKALAASQKVKRFDSLVIIGPNHTGLGEPIAVSSSDWQTPLGTVRNDLGLSNRIAEISGYASIDEAAHSEEHSIEVQLPFVRKALGDIKCVFICMGDQSYDACTALCKAILESAKGLKRNAAVIASSDFDHYEPASVAREKDLAALKPLKSLDTAGFNRILTEQSDTACGHGPITVAALFAKSLGAKKGVLLKYGNSGDITQDYGSVVAYASMVFV